MNYENYHRNVHKLLIIHQMCFQKHLKPIHSLTVVLKYIIITMEVIKQDSQHLSTNFKC